MLTKVVVTQRGPVEYSEAGTGEGVLYFHGTGVTGDVMLTVEKSLVDDGFRLIVPNRPGYGWTPLDPHRTASGCADVAAALLSALGIEQVSVMGSSGGAAFAAAFAIHHPARTKSLVLLCPQLHRWDDKRWLPQVSRWTLPWLRRPLLRAILLALYRFQMQRLRPAQFLKMEAGDRYPDVADDPTSQELCALTIAAAPSGTRCAGFENDFLVFTREDIAGPNAVLQPPTLIIHDLTDPMAPPNHVEWFTSIFPKCEVLSLHAAGHLIWAGPDAKRMHAARVRFLREYANCPV
jgi:pimeloyl-ACP methyl ester carboxylesterase